MARTLRYQATWLLFATHTLHIAVHMSERYITTDINSMYEMLEARCVAACSMCMHQAKC